MHIKETNEKTKKTNRQKQHRLSHHHTLKQHLLVKRVLMHMHYSCLNLVFFHVVKAIKRGKE